MHRFFDIIFAAFALLVLSPLLIPIALILRFSGEGEILFLQRRVGFNGAPFELYKFATMLKNSPNIGTGTVTVRGDPRVLPVGRFLRKTKINELPQLLNIINGDMSFIGPRPQTQRCFNAFPSQAQETIVKVRPGLSGIGSIVFRDEEDMMHGSQDPNNFYDHVIMPYKGKLEEWFVDNQSIWTYFKLIALTIWVVFVPESAAVWKLFPNLPRPDHNLVSAIKYKAPT